MSAAIATPERVIEVCEALKAQGKPLEYKTIVEELGGGSNTTIKLILDTLKAVEKRSRGRWPAAVWQAFEAALDLLWKAASDSFSDQLSDERSKWIIDSARKVDQVKKEHETQIADLVERLAAAESQVVESQCRIDQLENDLKEETQRIQPLTELINKLREDWQVAVNNAMAAENLVEKHAAQIEILKVRAEYAAQPGARVLPSRDAPNQGGATAA